MHLRQVGHNRPLPLTVARDEQPTDDSHGPPQQGTPEVPDGTLSSASPTDAHAFLLRLQFESLEGLVQLARSKRDGLLLAAQLEPSPSAETQAALRAAQTIVDQFGQECERAYNEWLRADQGRDGAHPVQRPQPPTQDGGNGCQAQAPVLARIRQLWSDKEIKSQTASALARCHSYPQALHLIYLAAGARQDHDPWYKVRHTFWCPLLKRLSFYAPRHGQLLACMLLINCYQPAKERCAPEFFDLLATTLPREEDGWPLELGPYQSVCLRAARHYLPLVREGKTRRGGQAKQKPTAKIVESVKQIERLIDSYSQQSPQQPQIDMSTLASTPWPSDL